MSIDKRIDDLFLPFYMYGHKPFTVTISGRFGVDGTQKVFQMPYSTFKKAIKTLTEGNDLVAPKPEATTDVANPPQAAPMKDLREKITKMLDNTILDWNRPSQLTTGSADANYNKLIPAIEKLFHQELERVIGPNDPTDKPRAATYLTNLDRNQLRAEIRKRAGLV